MLYNAQNILGFVAFTHLDYQQQQWHTFLLYQTLNITSFLYNAFVLHRAPWTHHIGCVC